MRAQLLAGISSSDGSGSPRTSKRTVKDTWRKTIAAALALRRAAATAGLAASPSARKPTLYEAAHSLRLDRNSSPQTLADTVAAADAASASAPSPDVSQRGKAQQAGAPDGGGGGGGPGTTGAVEPDGSSELKTDHLALCDHRTMEMDKDEFERFASKQIHDHKKPTWLTFRSVIGLPLITPWATYYRMWYYFIWLMDTVYTSFVFPWYEAYLVGFPASNNANLGMSIFQCIAGCIFLADAVIEIHVPWMLRYKNDRMLVVNGGRLYWLALTRTWWLCDLISACIFLAVTISVFSNTSSTALQALRLVRLTRLHRTFELCLSLMLGTWVTSDFGTRVLVSQRWMSLRLAFVCGLLFTSLVILNLLACLWWFVGTGTSGIYPDPGDRWVGNAGMMGNVVDDNATSQYITALYYVFTTMTTTGYGDITANNWIEAVTAIAIMCFSGVFFAFLIGSVVKQLLERGPAAKRSAAFLEKATTQELFVRLNCVSKEWWQNVFKYLSDIWIGHQEQSQLWGIFDDLSYTLKAQLMAEVMGEELRSLDVFSAISQSTLLHLSSLLEPMPLTPNSIVYEAGDDADSIYVLQEGRALATCFFVRKTPQCTGHTS
ncbi:hypothetical protein FOA52_009677 [Chlamydomonas sp. UWO 241]|nr:hypothetical protein FOA52_009677 [Chlamydomonas sp. UWO 241]